MKPADPVLALRAAWSRSSYGGQTFGVQVINPSQRCTIFRWADYEGKQNGALGRAFGDEAAVAMANALLAELKELRRAARRRPTQIEAGKKRRIA